MLTGDPAAVYATKSGNDGLAPNVSHPGTDAQRAADLARADDVIEARAVPITVSGVAITAARKRTDDGQAIPSSGSSGVTLGTRAAGGGVLYNVDPPVLADIKSAADAAAVATDVLLEIICDFTNSNGAHVRYVTLVVTDGSGNILRAEDFFCAITAARQIGTFTTTIRAGEGYTLWVQGDHEADGPGTSASCFETPLS